MCSLYDSGCLRSEWLHCSCTDVVLLLYCCAHAATPAPAAPQTVLQLYHEEVQYAVDGGAVQCTKCLREVVGAHYQNEEPGFPTVVLCMTCCWEEQILQTAGAADGAVAVELLAEGVGNWPRVRLVGCLGLPSGSVVGC